MTITTSSSRRTASAAKRFKRIGEEVSEQLDCVPAQFFVLRNIRGKYACACCQTIQAAPMPAQMIDKGIPAPGLLAHARALLDTAPRELAESFEQAVRTAGFAS